MRGRIGSGEARVGCSGWQYKDWRGVVYPEGLPQRAWFEHYATRFDTVEINNTFYRLPPPATVEGWARQGPSGFVYALKLGQFGSHRMKLRDATSWLPNHLDRTERLGTHLGPTLVQLPPRWKRNTERLDEFLTVCPKTMRWAVELRDPSWLHDDVYEVLRAHAPRSAITTYSPITRGCARPIGCTSASMGRMRSNSRTLAPTRGRGCSGRRSVWPPSSMEVTTCTPISTTTGTATRSPMRRGWRRGSA